MWSNLIAVLVLVACSTSSIDSACEGEIVLAAMTDPAAVAARVRAARLRRFDVDGRCADPGRLPANS